MRDIELDADGAPPAPRMGRPSVWPFAKMSKAGQFFFVKTGECGYRCMCSQVSRANRRQAGKVRFAVIRFDRQTGEPFTKNGEEGYRVYRLA